MRCILIIYFILTIFTVGAGQNTPFERNDSLWQNIGHRKYELNIGVQFARFHLEANPNYILGLEDYPGNYLNLFVHVNRVLRSKKNPRLQYRVGLGVAWESLTFSPFITVNEAGIAPLDSVRISEFQNEEFQLHLPMSVAYDFPDFLREGLGCRLFFGLEHRLRVHRNDLDNSLVFGFDFQRNTGQAYSDGGIQADVNAYYANFIGYYSLQLNLGVGIMDSRLGSGGVKLTNLIVPAFREGQQLSRQLGLLLFLEVPL